MRYNPYLHLLAPSLFGLGAIIGAIIIMSEVSLLAVLTIPITFYTANAIEWWAHKNLLHKETRIARPLWEQHTKHHEWFTYDSMEITHMTDLQFVLMPAWGVAMIVVFLLMTTLPIALVFSTNVAALFLITAVGYVISYEWLHLVYHLPETHFLFRLPGIRFLQGHHRTHHDRMLMDEANFNVTFPFADFIMKTDKNEGWD